MQALDAQDAQARGSIVLLAVSVVSEDLVWHCGDTVTRDTSTQNSNEFVSGAEALAWWKVASSRTNGQGWAPGFDWDNVFNPATLLLLSMHPSGVGTAADADAWKRRLDWNLNLWHVRLGTVYVVVLGWNN
jgi:hypothetical protein